MKTALRLVLGLIAGAMVGAFGTAIHRTLWHGFPIGLVIALALTISAALFIRAAAGFNTFAAFGVGWILMVQLLSLPNSGGDVLIVDPRENVPWAAAGLIWTYLGAAFIVLSALLPARWFRPVPAQQILPPPQSDLPAAPQTEALPTQAPTWSPFAAATPTPEPIPETPIGGIPT